MSGQGESVVSVTIIRQREYDDVFSGAVQVPERLEPGLRWIQAHCPLHEPTRVSIADLALAWGVPEVIVRPGLTSLARTGYFLLEEQA